MNKKPVNQRGYFISVMTIFIMIIMSTIALSMGALIFHRQRISTNSVKASQSYYTAEAGIEDALLRLSDNPQITPSSYSLSVGNTSATVDIPAIVGTSRIVTSIGSDANRIRNIRVVYNIDSDGVGFHYGAQIGAGGLAMDNGTTVTGNVFSNGNITGSGTITNNVIVATNGNSIDGVNIGGNALAYSCLAGATVSGNLTYVTGGTHTCSVAGSTYSQSDEISSQPMPISDAQILEWKADATAGGVIVGNYTVNGAVSLGPKMITGNLTLANNAILNLTGTIYVVGTMYSSNNSTIKLDISYGGLSGIILSDGTIDCDPNVVYTGSGQAGSYLLVLSTNSSNTAISVRNNVNGAILYTSTGGIEVYNNVDVKQLTGYRVHLNNNATINYSSGLASLLFTSGPSAGWTVTEWKEQ